MVSSFEAMLHRYAAESWDKQAHLLELLGEDYTWFYDMDEGTLRLGEYSPFKMQILGSESTISNTWMWAWANKQSDIPPDLLKTTNALRAYGKKHGMVELTQQQFDLSDDCNGHILAMIASGFSEATVYYRGPYEEGAVFVLVLDAAFPTIEAPDPLMRIPFVFEQLISNVRLSNHRKALKHYLQWYGLTVEDGGHNLIGRTTDERAITAEFDDLKRLTYISTSLKK